MEGNGSGWVGVGVFVRWTWEFRTFWTLGYGLWNLDSELWNFGHCLLGYGISDVSFFRARAVNISMLEERGCTFRWC